MAHAGRHGYADRRRAGRHRRLYRHGAVLVDDGGSGGDRADHLDHRILYRHAISSGPLDRQIIGNRSRHQCDPGAGDFDGSHGLANAGDRRRHCRRVPAGWPDRHCLCGHRHAGARRNGRGARRLWSGDGQCWRHCRNGGAGRERPQQDRRARRGGQYHQGSDQGLCHWFCRARGAGIVLGLYR